MARILFATQPLTGHVQPFVPLARRLVERGHEVRWYGGRRFRPAVEATGALLVPTHPGIDFDERKLGTETPVVIGQPGLAGARAAMRRLFVEPGPAQARDLAALLSRWPAEALVLDPSLVGATIFATEPMPPRIGIGIFPLAFSSRDTPPFGPGLHPAVGFSGRLRDALLRRLLPGLPYAPLQRRVNDLRASQLQPPLERFFLEEAYLQCDLFLQCTVPGFEYPRRDLPRSVRFVGPILSEVDTDWEEPDWWSELTHGKPVVLVTQGTFATDPTQLLLPTLRALAAEDLLVVATWGASGAEIGRSELPINARVERFLPFDRLLPHVDVMVTNGGYGGVQSALRHGVPLVVAGRSEEKGETAARVSWSGVGIDLRTSTPRPSALRRAVLRVLDTARFSECAGAMRAEVARSDGVAQAAAYVESSIAGRHSRP